MKIMRYFILIYFFAFTSCVVKPIKYTYQNKFSLENYNKQNSQNYLRTDCVYVNSEEEDYGNGKRKTFEFMRFFKNGRVYISKTFFDTIPKKEFTNFISLEDIYEKTKKFDYNSGRKAYYLIENNGILKIEQYVNAGTGCTIREGILDEFKINFKKENKIYKIEIIENKINEPNW
jgi:hypothetical protein